MSTKNLITIAAVGVGAWLLLRKQGRTFNTLDPNSANKVDVDLSEIEKDREIPTEEVEGSSIDPSLLNTEQLPFKPLRRTSKKSADTNIFGVISK